MAVAPLQGLFANPALAATAMEAVTGMGHAMDGGGHVPGMDNPGAADGLCDCCPEDQTPACTNCVVNHCTTGHCGSIAILAHDTHLPLRPMWVFSRHPSAGLPSASPASLFRPPRA